MLQSLEPRRLLSVSLLKDIAPGTADSNPTQFFGSSIGTFFIAGSGEQKLWKTDGTPGGTVMVKSLRSTSNLQQTDIDTTGSAFGELDGKVYFFGDDGTHGFELFVTDGTDAGTHLVKDITPGAANSVVVNSGNDPFMPALLLSPQFTRVGDRLLFLTIDSSNGIRRWTTDGTEAGTQLLRADLVAEPFSNGTPGFAVFNGFAYFPANDGVNGRELWRTDGAPAGTVRVTDLAAGGANTIATGNEFVLRATGNGVYFHGTDGTHDGLWYSDGTAANTRFLTAAYDGDGPTMPAGDGLFFWGNTAAAGSELWHTDGTVFGTSMVLDINPGTAGSIPNGGNGPNSWADIGDATILFNALSPGNTSTRLWRSDGTAAGTYLVTRTSGSGFTKPGPFTVLNGIAYFTDSAGTSWYRTDGTVSTRTGTALFSVTPRNARAINGVIYVSMSGGGVGAEPTIQTDEFAPLVRSSAFRYDTPQHRAAITFSENVAPSLTVADVSIADPVTNAPLPPGSFDVALDPTGKVASVTFPGFTNKRLPDGNYRLTITGSGVADPAGNAMAGTHVLDFFVFAGDANHDRTVDLTDFTFLAANFNGTGKTFADGDFDYNGKVDLTDFTILASKFNTTLNAPAAAAATVALAVPVVPTAGLEAVAARTDRAASVVGLTPDDDVLGAE